MFFSDYAAQDASVPKNQEAIKDYFIKTVNDNNISHAYIFEGSKGIGKFNMAIYFAKLLLCLDLNEKPCNICSSCQKIISLNHPDLHILSSEDSIIKRESIDELIDSTNKKPYESDRKVYIINNIEDMTSSAANTFLKTLEEPAGNTTIILLTQNCNLILPTIVSRTQIIKFEKISSEHIKNHIKDKFKLDNTSAKLIANYSQGVLYSAERMAENKDDILKFREEIIKIFDRFLDKNRNAIFEYETYFEDNKDKIYKITEILLIWLRDISFKKHDLDDLIINVDLLDLLDKHSKILKRQRIDELINCLQGVNNDVSVNVNYKLIIDNMLIIFSRQ